MAVEPDRTGVRRRWKWVLLLLALGVLFVGLRGIHALADRQQQSAIFTDQVVVVGVTGRIELRRLIAPCWALTSTMCKPERSPSVPAMSGTALRPAGPLWALVAGLPLVGCALQRSRTER